MNLEERINNDIKEAMRSKDKVALDALRAVKSQLLLLKTAAKDAEVDEKEEIALLQKQIKQRKEAAEQFEQNGRKELAEIELQQAEVIENFLPAQLSDEELTEQVQKIIEEVNASSIKDMGKVMAKASSTLMGKADGKSISLKVKELLPT